VISANGICELVIAIVVTVALERALRPLVARGHKLAPSGGRVS